MGVHELLQWWNLIYVAPLLVSIVWIVATVVAGTHGGDLSHGGHGIGHDAGHDVGHVVHNAVQNVEHAVSHAFGLHHGGVAANHAAGHGVTAHGHAGANGHAAPDGHAHGQDAHPGTHDSVLIRVLTLLGIGQVPITLLIGVFLLCWGAFGMVANHFFGTALRFPALYIWPSMGVTFVASAVVTRSMAAVVGRMLPTTETYGVSRAELCGSLGKTVFATTESAGTVDIKDRYGTVHRVQAKTEAGKEAIPSNTEVIVVDFDEADKRFIVERSTL